MPESCATQPRLEKIAEGVRRRGVALPVSFLLEMHRPLTHVIGSALVLSRPFVVLLLGVSGAALLEEIFSSRKNLDYLTDLLQGGPAQSRLREQGRA